MRINFLHASHRVGPRHCAIFAAERVLTLSFGGELKRVTTAGLLARPDAASLTVPDDVSYHRAMTYRAVPLLGLIGDASRLGFDTIEARASDGFVSQIPASLVAKGAVGRCRGLGRGRGSGRALAEPAGGRK